MKQPTPEPLTDTILKPTHSEPFAQICAKKKPKTRTLIVIKFPSWDPGNPIPDPDHRPSWQTKAKSNYTYSHLSTIIHRTVQSIVNSLRPVSAVSEALPAGAARSAGGPGALIRPVDGDDGP